MGRIFLALSIIVIILMIAVGGGIYGLISVDVAKAREEAANATAQGVAIGVAAQIEQLHRTLLKMAQDQAIIQALETGDAIQIATVETQLEKYWPGVLAIRLLKPGISELDTGRVPHMGFADLDMVRETFKASQTPVVQGDAGPNRHLAMTARVLMDNRVVGVILASLSYDFIKTSLNKASVNGQFIQLKQADLDLATVGDAQLNGQAEQITIKVPNTQWTVRGWYEKSASISDLSLIGAMLLVATALTVLVFFVGYRKFSNILSRDQSSVLKAVKDLMIGNAHGNYPIYLSEMEAIISTLVQFKRVLNHEEGAVTATEAGSDDFDGFFEESDFVIDDVVSHANKAPKASFATAIDLPGSDAPFSERQSAPTPASQFAEIFRAYDIRGIVGKTLTNDLTYDIGRALGTEARKQGSKTVVIARDGRNSSPGLADALAKGLASTGCHVLDLGRVPTPVLYFVTQHTEGHCGVMVTGSHNPAEYNGLKMVIKGETLAGPRIAQIRACIEQRSFVAEAEGNIEQNSLFVNEYVGTISEDVHLVRPMKVVLDCGNGVAGEIAPVLLRTLGCEVIELFCDIDGNFPNHHPDPSKPENLSDLIASVKHYQADVGIALDGDGDRLGVIDSNGKIIWPDRQMMLFAKDVLARKPGAEIIFDVKCSRHLPEQIAKFGGRSLMWKTGHSFMKAKVKETGAKLAGEMSGHIFFNDRWFGFDDGLYAAVRMIEILSADTRSSAEVFADFPDSINTPELSVPMAEGENVAFIEQMFAKADFKDAHITKIDGLRVDFADGWGLVRASNTTPSLVLRFEADDERAFRRIENEFKALMTQIKPDIALPF